MRVLVTGGAGYIGSRTVRRLIAGGHDVLVLDNLSTGHREAVPGDRLVIGDLADIWAMARLLKGHRPEAVFHFAASAYVGESVTDPAKYYRNNVANTLDLLDGCRAAGVGRFILSSTCATYGLPETVPIREDAPQVPINPYGNTKLAAERALADYAAAYRFGFCSLRFFNAAGASLDGTIGEDHDPETHLIPLLIQAALGQRSHVEIFGTDYPTPDGTCIRDYVHVDDLAEAHILAMEAIGPSSARAYNVGIGHGVSVRELVRTVEQVSGLAVPVKEGPRRPGDSAVLIADAGRIHRELGWSPQYISIEAIVETAWNWHRTHPAGFRPVAGPARQPS